MLPKWLQSMLIMLILVSTTGLVSISQAQDAVPSPSVTVPPLAATRLDPMQINSGQPTTILIQGASFTSQTMVRLVGQGMLPTSVSNDTTLTAVIPAHLNAGEYQLEVVDPVNGTVSVPQTLTIQPAPTVTPTLRPPMEIQRFEPASVTSGSDSSISIFGRNFTSATTIRLIGYGILNSQVINRDVIVASLPTGIRAGTYSVEVSDPESGTLVFPLPLTVLAAATPAPPPTPIIPPTATPEPPTPVPGEPALITRNFTVRPATITPGSSLVLYFEVVNQGSRLAQGVSVGVDGNGKFLPAQGGASVTLPDVPVGGAIQVTLGAVAAQDLPPGPTVIPLVMHYRDFSGSNYTSNATLSVNVAEVSEASQIVLAEYEITPDPVLPGAVATVRAVVVNTGNETANQVLLRVTGGDNILLPGTRGDSFPIGTLRPGARQEITFTMIVNGAAEAGTRAQPVSITHLRGDQTVEYTTAMTVTVDAQTIDKPLLLLENYSAGTDQLIPGANFTLNLQIRNVGAGTAKNVLAMYGVADTNVPSDGQASTDTGSGTTPGNIFAPLGTGGTIYVGDIASASPVIELAQAFIVNGTVKSGIYTLPITLEYQLENGDTQRTVLRTSLVIVAPPAMQITLQNPIPEMVNAGEPLPIALKIANVGDSTIRLLRATIEASNGQVVEGALIPLAALLKEKDTTLNAMLIPDAEGAVTVTVTIIYTDDLNQERHIIQTYSTSALPALPPMEEPPFPTEPEPTPDVVQEEDEGFDVGRFLLGLVGLGS